MKKKFFVLILSFVVIMANFLFSYGKWWAEVLSSMGTMDQGGTPGRVFINIGWPLQFLSLNESTLFSFLPFIFDLSFYFILIWIGLGFKDKLMKKKK